MAHRRIWNSYRGRNSGNVRCCSHRSAASQEEKNSMKTAEEYITELDHNSQGHDALLYVGFKNTTVAVKSDDPNRLRVLQEAMANDGLPFAFARLKPGKVEMGLLPEYE